MNFCSLLANGQNVFLSRDAEILPSSNETRQSTESQKQALISRTRKLASKFSRNSQASHHWLSVNLQTLQKVSERFAKGTTRTQVTIQPSAWCQLRKIMEKLKWDSVINMSHDGRTELLQMSSYIKYLLALKNVKWLWWDLFSITPLWLALSTRQSLNAWLTHQNNTKSEQCTLSGLKPR